MATSGHDGHGGQQKKQFAGHEGDGVWGVEEFIDTKKARQNAYATTSDRTFVNIVNTV
jgi:hypothetical protein